MEDHDAADPPLRTLNVFYQGTNVEMLEETYFKFKKNILPKMKKMQPNFQEPVVEYCEPDQVIDICSYNHYPVLDKTNETQEQHNDDNDIYDTSELEHEFEYGIYEDVFKTEQLMAELKRIDEAKQENKKLKDFEFKDFPLEQFSDAGKVANEGDPHLKVAADTELYDLEKRTIQIDIDRHEHENSSDNTDDNSSLCADDNSSQNADDYIQPTKVSHVQSPTVGEKYHVDHDDNTLCKKVYGPTYVPYSKDSQKLLLPQTTDMSRKDNLKLLYNSLPKGMCDNEYRSLEQAINDVETFQYSHETSTKHVLVQGVYVGSASPLIADIKTQPYSVLTYMDDGMMTGTYDNTHDIPIYVDNGSLLNIMPTYFYDKAYYLHHKTTIEVIADRTNELQYKELIEGQGIVWVWSNDSSKPLQLIVGTFHNDKTLITFENTTGQTQYISKGAKVAVLDMRSKDGGMTNFEWDIPTDDEGNLVLYVHTFASSLEPTKLANEDPVL